MCSSWLFTRSSIQIQAWSVHQIRPNRGVGLRRRIDGTTRRVERAVSRDSQRLRHWTPDEPVDDLLVKVDRRLPLAVSHPAQGRLDKAAVSFYSRSQTDTAVPLYSRSRLDTQAVSLAFRGGLLTKADRKNPHAVPLTADRPTDTAVPYTADGDSTPGSYSLAFPALAFLDTPPGTRDWSIARDCSCPPPIGCLHVSPTDTLRALGGASSERGRKNKQGASRSTTTVQTLDSRLHLPTHM